MERAWGAARAWGRTTPVERAELLLKITDAVEAEAEEFARLECENVGKPITFAREEMPWVYDVMRFSAGAARVSSALPPENMPTAAPPGYAGSRSGSASSRHGTIRC